MYVIVNYEPTVSLVTSAISDSASCPLVHFRYFWKISIRLYRHMEWNLWGGKIKKRWIHIFFHIDVPNTLLRVEFIWEGSQQAFYIKSGNGLLAELLAKVFQDLMSRNNHMLRNFIPVYQSPIHLQVGGLEVSNWPFWL